MSKYTRGHSDRWGALDEAVPFSGDPAEVALISRMTGKVSNPGAPGDHEGRRQQSCRYRAVEEADELLRPQSERQMNFGPYRFFTVALRFRGSPNCELSDINTLTALARNVPFSPDR